MNKLTVPVLLGFGILATVGREIAFAQYFGDSLEIEIFRLAFALPNILTQSLAPAVLGAIIPLLVRADTMGEKYRTLFIQKLIMLNILLSLAFTIIGLLSSSFQASVLAPGFTSTELQLLASRISMLWIFFMSVSLSFGVRAVLNERSCFWPGSSSSLVLGASFFLGCILFKEILEISLSSLNLTWFAIFGGFILLCLHLSQQPIPYKPFSFQSSHDHPDSIGLRIISTAVLTVGAHHIIWSAPRLIDRAVATTLPQGVVAALEYSYSIITVPAILLATSFITVFYPPFVRSVVGRSLQGSYKSYLYPFIGAFLTALLLGFLIWNHAEWIVKTIFGRGLFGEEAAANTAMILRWHALALGPTVGAFILSHAVLGLQGIKLLFIADAIRLAAKVTSISLLVEHYGIDGLAISFIATEVASFLTLILIVMVIAKWKSRNPADQTTKL